jgi:protein-disulfide isomerase
VEEHKLTKKEKKGLRKLEWQENAKNEARNAKIKKFSLWVGIAAIFLIVAFVLFESVTSSTPSQTQNINIAPVSARDIKEGDPNAKVALVEYADFDCSACAIYHPLINQLLNDYKDKIYYVYRMFPLEQSHQNALISAQAAYAAYKQGKFFEYSDLLFQNQSDWATILNPKPILTEYAKDLKLDVGKFETDMNSDETKKYVKDSENQALDENISYTPSFFINDQLIQNPNSFDGFKQLIDAALNSK